MRTVDPEQPVLHKHLLESHLMFTPRLKLSLGMALLAGAATLAGCGPDPVTRTTTTTERTMSAPVYAPAPPAMTSTTTETIRH